LNGSESGFFTLAGSLNGVGRVLILQGRGCGVDSQRGRGGGRPPQAVMEAIGTGQGSLKEEIVA